MSTHPMVFAPSRLNVTDAFGYWFSGFFDGEGTFLVLNRVRGETTIVPKIKLVQRSDDRTVVEYIQAQLGHGVIHNNHYKSENYPGTKPWSDFRVTKISDLAEVVVPLFDRYPLHTKKAREFSLWRSVVQLCYQRQGRKFTAEEHSTCMEAGKLISRPRGRTPARTSNKL